MTCSSFLPVWISDTEVDPKWLSFKIQRSVESAVAVDISNLGRRAEQVQQGATLRLKVTLEKQSDDGNDETSTLPIVVKQVPISQQPHSKMLGLAREALFYQHLAPKVKDISIPTIYHSAGDMETGAKVVLMQDCSDDHCIDSGILFGPGNPNNWTRDLPALLVDAYPHNSNPPPSATQVATATFVEIAKLHATFWKDTSLLQHGFLRASDWMQGQHKESWQASQGYIQNIWQDTSKMRQTLEWDEHVYQLVERAMKNISWERQLERLNPEDNKCSWTLVHGDFWPGNVLWSTTRTNGGEKQLLYLLDWEMVGIGSGPQDLGQYLLSNMDPKERRACEGDLIQTYYDELVKNGVQDFTWDECWQEYRVGGLERWLWFLVYFCGQEGPLQKWGQFFHDQIREFVQDHAITVDEIGQPRP